MTRAVTVGVVFEEGMEEVDDDVDGLMLEMVVVVVCCLPSSSLLLVSFSVVLLDCIGHSRGVERVLSVFTLMFSSGRFFGGQVPASK